MKVCVCICVVCACVCSLIAWLCGSEVGDGKTAEAVDCFFQTCGSVVSCMKSCQARQALGNYHWSSWAVCHICVWTTEKLKSETIRTNSRELMAAHTVEHLKQSLHLLMRFLFTAVLLKTATTLFLSVTTAECQQLFRWSFFLKNDSNSTGETTSVRSAPTLWKSLDVDVKYLLSSSLPNTFRPH